MIVHKILAAGTRRKGVKKFPKLNRTVQIRATAHVPSSGAVLPGAFWRSA
jgi:hypothetical protein